jgi:RNA polymerase sigma factor (sigma-70 family)
VSFTELVERAQRGESRAWALLVSRLERVVWKTVNMSTDDAEVRQDAAAATWLRLAENLATIRDPERLPGWMVTTARREVVAHFRRNRLVLDNRGAFREPPATESDPAERIEERELRQALRTAFRRLPDECQELLSLLILLDPPPLYEEVETQLQRPRGSYGELARLAADSADRPLELARGLRDERFLTFETPTRSVELQLRAGLVVGWVQPEGPYEVDFVTPAGVMTRLQSDPLGRFRAELSTRGPRLSNGTATTVS